MALVFFQAQKSFLVFAQGPAGYLVKAPVSVRGLEKEKHLAWLVQQRLIQTLQKRKCVAVLPFYFAEKRRAHFPEKTNIFPMVTSGEVQVGGHFFSLFLRLSDKRKKETKKMSWEASLDTPLPDFSALFWSEAKRESKSQSPSKMRELLSWYALYPWEKEELILSFSVPEEQLAQKKGALAKMYWLEAKGKPRKERRPLVEKALALVEEAEEKEPWNTDWKSLKAHIYHTKGEKRKSQKLAREASVCNPFDGMARLLLAMDFGWRTEENTRNLEAFFQLNPFLHPKNAFFVEKAFLFGRFDKLLLRETLKKPNNTQEGLVAYRQKKWLLAQKKFRQALEEKEDSFIPTFYLAKLSQKKDTQSEDWKMLLQLTKEGPTEPEALLLLGEIYLRKKQVGKAFQHYKQALSQEENLVEGWMGLAQSALLLKNKKELQEALRTLLAMAPKEPMVLVLEGYGHFLEEEREKAKASFLKALELQPNFEPAKKAYQALQERKRMPNLEIPYILEKEDGQ